MVLVYFHIATYGFTVLVCDCGYTCVGFTYMMQRLLICVRHIQLQEVYDHDFFSTDDKMGDAEFDIQQFVEGVKKNLQSVPSGTVITRIKPTKTNCLAEESCITWTHSAVVQDLCLRLRNVECGEVEIELHWIDVPGCTLL